MSKNETKLTTKVSSLISGQSPDFVQSDHPLFIKFLKDYYRFLEAGRLTFTATTQNIVTETVSPNIFDDNSAIMLTFAHIKNGLSSNENAFSPTFV